METTLEDLLHAINILQENRNILVDGYGEITICPPVRITPQALSYFDLALNATVIVDYKQHDTYIADPDEKIDKMAWELLNAIEGNTSDDRIKQWFEDPSAEIL